MIDQLHPNLLKQLEQINVIGVALSAERDNNRLLEMILLGAKEITNADGFIRSLMINILSLRS